MKKSVKGNVRPIDCLGRVHIPKEIRQKLNLQENDNVEVTVVLGNVVLTKVQEKCHFRFISEGNKRCSSPFHEGACDNCIERVKTNDNYNCEDESTGESYISLKGYGE
jgi:transcriptional pleiotropic regulator of transition state genes